MYMHTKHLYGSPHAANPVLRAVAALSLIVGTAALTGCPYFWIPPEIVTQPEPQVTGPGLSASFDVSASGSGLRYQWQKDGANIPGATEAAYDIENAEAADQGEYACLVSNLGGSVVSDSAELVVSVEYGQGYDEGFAEDDWYWQGFDDSLDTLGFSPMYYQGGDIPFVETPYYNRGYYDGVWYAYNDGYFVGYDYAFAIGFSEGYDAAFYSDYLDFLAEDQHIEYDNGGWSDGYNDGFSEGRVFGANDYEQGLTFDWLDALLDYESGTDLYFEEVDVGTGVYGPVYLYVYGTDPTAAKQLGVGRHDRLRRQAAPMAIRHGADFSLAAKSGLSLYRLMPDDERARFDLVPDTTPRSSRDLTLTTTWLERIQEYVAAIDNPAKSTSRLRAADK